MKYVKWLIVGSAALVGVPIVILSPLWVPVLFVWMGEQAGGDVGVTIALMAVMVACAMMIGKIVCTHD